MVGRGPRRCLGSRTLAHVMGLKVSKVYRRRWGGGNKPRCGANTRSGKACLRRELFKSGRCRNHGGMSTGPKTAEGHRRCAEGRARARQWNLEARSREKAGE